MSAREKLAKRLREAFLDHGFDSVTMSALAEACGLTRRALYHHFSSKEEAFRYVLRHDGEVAISEGMEAGRALMDDGASAVEVLTEIMDRRYGDNRRRLTASPHGVQLFDHAIHNCHDIIIEHSALFHDELAVLIGELEARGLLRLTPPTDARMLSELLSDGARGSNQTQPPLPVEQVRQRYATIIEAILFGVARPPAWPGEG